MQQHSPPAGRNATVDHPQQELDLGAHPPTELAERTKATAGEIVVASAEPILTLAPNPAFGDLVEPARPVKDVSVPFEGAIAAGKNTYVYDAHTYHTKVPPQGIAQLVEHFTNPGDVVLDPFCGSGMAAVATLERGRVSLASDLSPAACFITFNHATPADEKRYWNAVQGIMRAARELDQWLYRTDCRTCGALTSVLYTVWSFGVICSHCEREFKLWDVARDERESVRESKIKKSFDCPHCGVHIQKRGLRRTQRYPVQLGYKCCEGGMKEQTVELNARDIEHLDAIRAAGVPDDLWYPTNQFPPGVNTKQAISAGITTVNRAYTPRALWAMAFLWDQCLRWPEQDLRPKLMFTVTSLYRRVTHFSEFRFWGGSGNTANYNVPAISNEQNVFKTFERKARTIRWYFRDAPKLSRALRVSVQSAAHLAQLPSNSIDYVFTDPPFGGNINYSEMNFIWESWLGVHTDISEEAIINKVQGKNADDYEDLLRRAFVETRRVLKPNGWLTVVFHNSSAKVWQALQGALRDAGFAISGTQTFDKKHGTFKQFVSENAVGYDLVLHCRKSERISGKTTDRAPDSEASARVFIRGALTRSASTYRTYFLHVTRASEFDYRRLYAEWLADAVGREGIVLSFEEFRALVNAETTPQVGSPYPQREAPCL